MSKKKEKKKEFLNLKLHRPLLQCRRLAQWHRQYWFSVRVCLAAINGREFLDCLVTGTSNPANQQPAQPWNLSVVFKFLQICRWRAHCRNVNRGLVQWEWGRNERREEERGLRILDSTTVQDGEDEGRMEGWGDVCTWRSQRREGVQDWAENQVLVQDQMCGCGVILLLNPTWRAYMNLNLWRCSNFLSDTPDQWIVWRRISGSSPSLLHFWNVTHNLICSIPCCPDSMKEKKCPRD